MSKQERISQRASAIRETMGVSLALANVRARRECDLASYMTPWELRGSVGAEQYLAWYIAQTTTTVQ